MEIKSYQHQAEEFVEHYLLADPFLPYTSVLAGIFLCKLVIFLLLFTCNSKLHFFSFCFKHCSLWLFLIIGIWSYWFIQLNPYQIILSSYKNEENWMEQQVSIRISVYRFLVSAFFICYALSLITLAYNITWQGNFYSPCDLYLIHGIILCVLLWFVFWPKKPSRPYGVS